jgi:hypothetical protein
VESAPHAFAGLELIEWLIARKPSMIGSDSNFDGPRALVHTEELPLPVLVHAAARGSREISAQELVVGLSLPHIVADAIDGGACWLTNQRMRKYRNP